MNTLREKDILSFLSTRNVIPKYGFPVDVVELQISYQCEEARRLELERDLRIALSEYAPGSQVVAGGKLWTSRYVKKVFSKAWQTFCYAICDHCKNYYTTRKESKILRESLPTAPFVTDHLEPEAFSSSQNLVLLPKVRNLEHPRQKTGTNL